MFCWFGSQVSNFREPRLVNGCTNKVVLWLTAQKRIFILYSLIRSYNGKCLVLICCVCVQSVAQCFGWCSLPCTESLLFADVQPAFPQQWWGAHPSSCLDRISLSLDFPLLDLFSWLCTNLVGSVAVVGSQRKQMCQAGETLNLPIFTSFGSLGYLGDRIIHFHRV